MFKLIIFAVGVFLGFLIADSFAALDPLRSTVRQALVQARATVAELIGKVSTHPLAPVGIALIVFFLVLALLSYSSALVLGLLFGAIYKDEIGHLPFVSGIAGSIRSKIASLKKPS